MDDSEIRLRLARAGAKNVREKFSTDPGLDRLATKLRGSQSRKQAA
jgi:hypothetical protein